MSIWDDEWEEYELEKADFEAWLDSLEGEGTDEEKYNEACKPDKQYEKWLEDNIDDIYEEEVQSNYPEWVIQTPKYIYRICLN